MANDISKVLNQIITQRLLDVHTAFIAKVESVSISDRTAAIQPVSLAKTVGRPAEKRPLQTGVPVLLNALYYINGAGGVSVMKAGDIVFCVCADREIAHAIKGDVSLPTAGWHHEMTDAIVVGVVHA